MTQTLEGHATDAGAALRSHRPRRRGPWVVAFGVVAMTTIAGVGAWWWLRGGGFLEASGAGYGGPAAPGQLFSVGISLETTSGQGVTLERVSATQPPGAVVIWSVYRAPPRAEGFGAWRGALTPRRPTRPVHGYRVEQAAGHPERGSTWIVASMRASRPGVYHLSNVTVSYRSGPRTRHAASHTDLCLLVYPVVHRAALLVQINSFEPNVTSLSAVDPLVAQYELCSDPTLSQ